MKELGEGGIFMDVPKWYECSEHVSVLNQVSGEICKASLSQMSIGQRSIGPKSALLSAEYV